MTTTESIDTTGTSAETGPPIYPTVAICGHRTLTGTGTIEWVKTQLAATLNALTEHHTTTVVVGMGTGVDRHAARAVLDAGLDLHIIAPFVDPAEHWPGRDWFPWHRMVPRAARTTVCGTGPTPAAWRERDRLILDAADALVAVWDGARHTGRTADMVRNAVTADLPVIHHDPITMSTRTRGDW